jgi:hypothetical protein
MIKKLRQALNRKGYTADEIERLLKSFTELLDNQEGSALHRSQDGGRWPSC